jgi:Fe-S oxidoreductase
LKKLAGFDRRRILPAYANISRFINGFKSRKVVQHENTSKKVVLFADTYMNFHEPGIGISAVELLESCGYEVMVANPGCCQRPKISHGFLRDAKKEGLKTAKDSCHI